VDGRARAIGGAAVVCIALLVVFGPSAFLPEPLAYGRPTRDLFDHIALLDQWATRVDEWAFPTGGVLLPPDPFGMAWAAPALAAGASRALAWNLSLVLHMAAAAAAGAWLGRRAGHALVGALAFGLSPYLLGQLASGEAETLAVFPLALSLACLDRGGRVGQVGAGLCAALAALGAWYHGAFAGALLLLYGLRENLRPLPWRARAAAFLPAGVAVAAIALPAAVYAGILADPAQMFRGPAMADYLAHHPRALAALSSDPSRWFGAPGGGLGHTDHLGGVIVLLAIVGWRGPGGVAHGLARWLVPLGLVFALGPVLHLGGGSTGIPLPGRILAELPLVGLMRLPHRWHLVVALGLAVLAARGAARLPRLAPLLLLGEALLFFRPDPSGVDLRPPVAHAGVDGPVLDLPPRTLGGDDARGRALVWQRAHRQPVPYSLLMQGWSPALGAEPLLVAVAALDRRDPIADRQAEAAQFRQVDFARAVDRARRGGLPLEDLRGAADRLRALGLRHVVLHRGAFDPADRAPVEAMLRNALGPPTIVGAEAWRWTL
jgi:hypothetical protein